jgi:hypothetical protein
MSASHYKTSLFSDKPELNRSQAVPERGLRCYVRSMRLYAAYATPRDPTPTRRELSRLEGKRGDANAASKGPVPWHHKWIEMASVSANTARNRKHIPRCRRRTRPKVNFFNTPGVAQEGDPRLASPQFPQLPQARLPHNACISSYRTVPQKKLAAENAHAHPSITQRTCCARTLKCKKHYYKTAYGT